MVEYVYDNAGTLTATSDYVADAGYMQIPDTDFIVASLEEGTIYLYGCVGEEGLKAEAEQLFNTTYADLAEAKAALLANNKCAFQNGTTYSLS